MPGFPRALREGAHAAPAQGEALHSPEAALPAPGSASRFGTCGRVVVGFSWHVSWRLSPSFRSTRASGLREQPPSSRGSVPARSAERPPEGNVFVSFHASPGLNFFPPFSLLGGAKASEVLIADCPRSASARPPPRRSRACPPPLPQEAGPSG